MTDGFLYMQPFGSDVIAVRNLLPVGGLPNGPVTSEYIQPMVWVIADNGNPQRIHNYPQTIVAGDGSTNPPGTVIAYPPGLPDSWQSQYLEAYPLGTETIDQSVAPDLVAVMIAKLGLGAYLSKGTQVIL